MSGIQKKALEFAVICLFLEEGGKQQVRADTIALDIARYAIAVEKCYRDLTLDVNSIFNSDNCD